MIKTDQYKKGVLTFIRKANEINSLVGEYKTHYLNNKAKFVVQLTNGELEINIDLVRQYENSSDMPIPESLRRSIEDFRHKNNIYMHNKSVHAIWNSLFTEVKK